MLRVDRTSVWNAQSAMAREILGRGASRYLGSLPGIDRAFQAEDLVIRCMDGRTPGGIHLAGSGILLGLDGASRFVGEVARLCGKVEAVTWHPDCGAAAAYSKIHGGDPLQNARGFAEALAKAVGVGLLRVENTAPAGFHPERAAYFDGTGVFDWSGVAGLPCGFVISRSYLDFATDYAGRELAMALSIALASSEEGGHGFSELFTPTMPFLVVVVARDRDQAKALQAEADGVLRTLSAKDRLRVKLDHIIYQR